MNGDAVQSSCGWVRPKTQELPQSPSIVWQWPEGSPMKVYGVIFLFLLKKGSPEKACFFMLSHKSIPVVLMGKRTQRVLLMNILLIKSYLNLSVILVSVCSLEGAEFYSIINRNHLTVLTREYEVDSFLKLRYLYRHVCMLIYMLVFVWRH